MTFNARLRDFLRNALRRALQSGIAAVQRAAAPEPHPGDIGDRLLVGRHTYGAPRVRSYRGDTEYVRIGAFCSLAEDIVITRGGNHPVDWPSTFPFRVQRGLAGAYADGLPAHERDVEIGNDVWIGREARILAGVQIGHGAVVGAYAVVASDVRPYAIVVGNPAREIRRRFTDAQVESLLQIAWWNWPDEKIDENIAYLNQPDIEEFVTRFRTDH